MREGGQPLVHIFPQDDSESLTPFFSHPVYRYAMERTSTFIKIWFWQRDVSNVPSDIQDSSSDSIDTAAWGTPTAYFPNTQCDIEDKFAPANIIINLTFCESHSFLVRQAGAGRGIFIYVFGIQVETGPARFTTLVDALIPARVRCVSSWQTNRGRL